MKALIARAGERIKKEPVLVSYIVAMALSLAAGFGLGLGAESVARIDMVLTLGAALFARQKVTPVSKLKALPPDELAALFADEVLDEDEAGEA